MTEQEAFIAANKALLGVVQQIRDDQWDLPIPKGVSTQQPMSLRELINYHAYDDAWVSDVLTGKTKEEVGERYDGDLLKDDPRGNYAKYNQLAQEAIDEFEDMDRVVHLSYGDFPACDYIQHITSFRGFRVWDLSRLLGLSEAMPENLVNGLWAVVVPHIDEWRKMGVFGPEIEVPEDADRQTKLLALSGRKA